MSNDHAYLSNICFTYTCLHTKVIFTSTVINESLKGCMLYRTCVLQTMDMHYAEEVDSMQDHMKHAKERPCHENPRCKHACTHSTCPVTVSSTTHDGHCRAVTQQTCMTQHR